MPLKRKALWGDSQRVQVEFRNSLFVEDLAISGFESEGFTFSEIFHGKRLERQTLSEGVFDTARLPQCEFSNLQHLRLTFHIKVLAGQSKTSIRLVIPRALKPEEDLRKLLCFSEWFFWGTICASKYPRGLSDWCLKNRVWSCCFHFAGGSPEQKRWKKISKSCSRVLIFL